MRRRGTIVAVVALAGMLAGCTAADIETVTQRAVTELTALAGISSGLSITGAAGREAESGTVSLALEDDVDAAELEAIVRGWAEPRDGTALEARTEAGGGVFLSPGVDTEAAVAEARNWLAVTAQGWTARLTVSGTGDGTWSAWELRTDDPAALAGVAEIREELTARGRLWTLRVDGSGVEVRVEVDTALPDDAAFRDLAARAAEDGVSRVDARSSGGAELDVRVL